jgi:AMP nucleosidase
MDHRISSHTANGFISPDPIAPQEFTDAAEAVAALEAIYDRNTRFLCEAFQSLATDKPKGRYRAFYPQVGLSTTSFGMVDSRLSYGHVVSPGHYAATITRPSLFRAYLKTQLELLLRNHDTPLTVSESDTPIPLHFAFGEGAYVEAAVAEKLDMPLRDLFDTPDLATTDDEIVNGLYEPGPGELCRWRPSRRNASTIRWPGLSHYTATAPDHFQNFVLFTNYQFYIDEFCDHARALMAEGNSEYEFFVEPGNLITPSGHGSPTEGLAPPRLPQMPAYHLKRKDHGGITMVNIGVGPSNAKTITDHVAVLTAPCLADAGPLRGPAQFPGAGRLCARPRLCARGPRAR